MDWSLVQSFLAVADTGSLSEGARQLGLSQPTVGRHVKALEDQLGVVLFVRHPKGLHLSDAGFELLPDARAMRTHVKRLELVAAGRQDTLEGTVRLTASVFLAHYVLPPILAQMRLDEPGIEIELVANDHSDNLLFREADIAVRMYEPKQAEIIALRLGDIPIGLFATPELAERVGHSIEELFAAGVVGFDADPSMIDAMRAAGMDVGPEDFCVRCDHQTVYWQLVRAGCGAGFSQRAVGLADSAVVELPFELPLPAIPVWLAAPEAMRSVPRIRRVWSHLKTHLTQYLAAG